WSERSTRFRGLRRTTTRTRGWRKGAVSTHRDTRSGTPPPVTKYTGPPRRAAIRTPFLRSGVAVKRPTDAQAEHAPLRSHDVFFKVFYRVELLADGGIRLPQSLRALRRARAVSRVGRSRGLRAGDGHSRRVFGDHSRHRSPHHRLRPLGARKCPARDPGRQVARAASTVVHPA